MLEYLLVIRIPILVIVVHSVVSWFVLGIVELVRKFLVELGLKLFILDFIFDAELICQQDFDCLFFLNCCALVEFHI